MCVPAYTYMYAQLLKRKYIHVSVHVSSKYNAHLQVYTVPIHDVHVHIHTVCVHVRTLYIMYGHSIDL